MQILKAQASPIVTRECGDAPGSQRPVVAVFAGWLPRSGGAPGWLTGPLCQGLWVNTAWEPGGGVGGQSPAEEGMLCRQCSACQGLASSAAAGGLCLCQV